MKKVMKRATFFIKKETTRLFLCIAASFCWLSLMSVACDPACHDKFYLKNTLDTPITYSQFNTKDTVPSATWSPFNQVKANWFMSMLEGIHNLNLARPLLIVMNYKYPPTTIATRSLFRTALYGNGICQTKSTPTNTLTL